MMYIIVGGLISVVIFIVLVIAKPTFIRKSDDNDRLTDKVDVTTAISLAIISGIIAGLVVQLHSIIT